MQQRVWAKRQFFKVAMIVYGVWMDKLIDNKNENIRLDKWLWAARFFRTRSLAAKAVTGGHVRLNSNRIKPSRSVLGGDILYIRRGELEFTVLVLKVISRRGPAVVARTLYEETPESIVARAKSLEERRLLRSPAARPERRPDKRERRKIREFLRKQ